MSTTLPPARKGFWQTWRDFWFAPADPTVLGFMRVVTGALVLYVHVAYCLDARAFMGPYAWYGNDWMTRERLEYPWVVGPFAEWDEYPSARLPEYGHRRQAVVAFLRGLPAEARQRDAALAFLRRVQKADGDSARLALAYVLRLSDVDLVRNAQLGRLADEKQRAVVDAGEIPDALAVLPPPDRAAAADEIRAFWAALPPDNYDRGYVLNHLIEMDPKSRVSFIRFATGLPADAAEREKRVAYLEYWNVDPAKVHQSGHAIFSIWFHVTDPLGMAIAQAVILVVMFLFTVGFCTRVTAVLTWLAAVSYIHRSQQVLFGMDTMSNILLIYLTIGNSGAALSVDRLIARYRAARASLRRTGTIDPGTRAFLDAPPPSATAGFALRLIQVHFCFIYMSSGLSKLKGGSWWNANAFWEVMANPEFTMIRYPWYEELLRFGTEWKPLFYGFTTASVWFTLALEISLPFLVWTRMRPWVVAAALTLHAGIGVLMGLNVFELLMMVLLLSYLPGRVIRESLLGAAGGKAGLRFDPKSDAQARAAARVLALDAAGQVAAEPSEKAGAVTLTGLGGPPRTGAAAVWPLARTLRLLRPVSVLFLVPGVSAVAARLLFPTTTEGNAAGKPAAPNTTAAAAS